MAGEVQQQDVYIKRVYQQIIMLALAAHFSYLVLFWKLGLLGLAAYNVASVAFYCVMQKAAGKGYFRLAVTCIHAEVCLFVTVCTVNAGWGIGAPLYLIAMTSLTYICPFDRKYIPYLFAVAEMIVFLVLKLYMDAVWPHYLAVSETAGRWLYLYNACASCVIILYAAFSSKVSAAVSRRELQAENRSLSELANYDQLTGLLSRHAFLKKLDTLNDEGRSIALAMSDIDDFKKVNDVWGHNCGDQVLSESAELVRRFLGPNVDVCRWGGEEFLFLFYDMDGASAAELLGKLCIAVSEHEFRWGESVLHITMTFGVSSGMECDSIEELVAAADKRMYEGKAKGKNQVVFDSLHEKIR